MFNKLLKKRKGFSLIEIISSLGILAIFMGLVSSIIFMSFRSREVTSEEHALQMASRDLADSVTHIVRYSTATFIMPESSFNSTNVDISLDFIPSGGFLTDGWNYQGVIDNTIVHLRWIEDYMGTGISGHTRQFLFDGAARNLSYELTFRKASADIDDNLVLFDLSVITLEGDRLDGGVGDRIEINIPSGAHSLMSMQIIDHSSITDPGVALAYRMDELPRVTPTARVVLVLDVSGSMDSPTGGAGIPAISLPDP
ncbi:MAG: type II secretion system GspH family protein [Defluviitaleaceae bacterium]|nr:type II secretion system GspH family protein [Defluviitaleaceae bacterium]